MMKLKKGDVVMITIGKDSGKKGKIEKIDIKNSLAFLPGLNVYKRHMKKKDEKNPGGIIEFSRPLSLSKLALICSKCGRQTRVGFNLKGKKKIRICRKCNVEI